MRRVRSSRERVARLAERQAGNVARHQLKHIGIGRGTIQRWIATGYLVPTLPGVYRVGHTAPSPEADLWAAVLYAKPGAALSHGTAAHWRGLIIFPPDQIHVTTPHRIHELPGVLVHAHR